jgi:hypothetical protein
VTRKRAAVYVEVCSEDRSAYRHSKSWNGCELGIPLNIWPSSRWDFARRSEFERPVGFREHRLIAQRIGPIFPSFDALSSCSLAEDSRARSDDFKQVRAENSGMKEGVAHVTLKNWMLMF